MKSILLILRAAIVDLVLQRAKMKVTPILRIAVLL